MPQPFFAPFAVQEEKRDFLNREKREVLEKGR